MVKGVGVSGLGMTLLQESSTIRRGSYGILKMTGVHKCFFWLLVLTATARCFAVPQIKDTRRFVTELQAESYARSIGKGYNKSSQKRVYTRMEKMQFCLDVRGWVVPTDKVYARLFELGEKPVWDEQDLQHVDAWVNHGLGYALRNLFWVSRSSHLSDLDKYLAKYYHDKSAACYLPCSLSEYRAMLEEVGPQQRGRVNAVCQPNCSMESPKVTMADRARCKCQIWGDEQSCQALDEAELDLMKSEGDRLEKELASVSTNYYSDKDRISDLFDSLADYTGRPEMVQNAKNLVGLGERG